MFISTSVIVFVAVTGLIAAGVWLLRGSHSEGDRPEEQRCQACGQLSSGRAKFCGHCGARLT